MLIPNPIEKERTADASDLSSAITLLNSIKTKLNELVGQYNLLVNSLEESNRDN